MSRYLRALVDQMSRAAVKPVLDRLSVHLDDSQEVIEAVVREAVRTALVEHLRGLEVRRARRR